jgi:hypothetical protein
MLDKFGSLFKALKFAYPQKEWDEQKISFTGKKSTQRYLSWYGKGKGRGQGKAWECTPLQGGCRGGLREL